MKNIFYSVMMLLFVLCSCTSKTEVALKKGSRVHCHGKERHLCSFGCIYAEARFRFRGNSR